MNLKSSIPSIVLLVLLSIALLQASARYVTLPVVAYPGTQEIRSGQLFKDESCIVEGIQMRNISLKSGKSFQPCTVMPPELVIKSLSYEIYSGNLGSSSKIITHFDQIKHSQNQLDSYIEQEAGSEYIYVILRSGDVKIYHRKFDSIRAEFFNGLKIPLPDKELLEVGYFVKVESTLLFVNNKYSIRVSRQEVQILEGYEPSEEYDSFQTAISILKGRYIAVGLRSGAHIYRLSKDRVALEKDLTLGSAELFPQKETALDLADLAFDEKNRQLLLLDESKGLYKVTLTPKSDAVPVGGEGNQTQTIKVVAGSPESVYEEPLCGLVFLESTDRKVYVGCSQFIVMIPLEGGDIAVLPHPEIKVREIEAVGRMVIFTGRNVFRIYDMAARQYLHYYQEFIRINKVHLVMDSLFHGQFYFTNEFMLVQGTFQIESPYVICQTEDPKYFGKETSILISSMGPCDEDYIAQSYRSMYIKGGNSKQGFDDIEFSPADTCFYQIEQKLYFWAPGQVNTRVLTISLLVLLAVSIVVLIIYLLSKLRLRNLIAVLNQYESLEDRSENTFAAPTNQKKPNEGKHVELIEEDDGRGEEDNPNWKPEGQDKTQQSEEGKESAVEVKPEKSGGEAEDEDEVKRNKEFYDIE